MATRPDEIAELLAYLTPEEQAELDALLLEDTPPDDAPAFLPDDPVAWIEREFFIPETMEAIKLEPYQRQVIMEALARDDGLLRYSLVLYSDLKKSAKSTIAAAVVLFLAWHNPWETCRVVGNDLKQADSRTFFYIRRAIELNPRLKPLVTVKNYKLTLPNHTSIEAIAVDPKGEAGGGDLIVCFTELWAAKNEAAKTLWTETTLSPLKFGRSMRWCESYAGFEGESPILEQLYESGVHEGRRIDDDLELYVNDDARMLTLWNTKPRCTWQTDDYYRQEEAILTPAEFRRVHRNEWAVSENAFVPPGWWDSCYGDVSVCTNPCVTALDAAVTDDSFAAVTTSRIDGKIYVMEVRVWYPPPNGKIDFAEVERYLLDLSKRRVIREFAYDKMQLEQLAQRLYGKAGYFREFSQGADRLVADKGLYDLIRDNLIVHANDPELNAHIANANAALEGDKLRIVKRKHEQKIDAAVALSMSAARTLFYRIGGR